MTSKTKEKQPLKGGLTPPTPPPPLDPLLIRSGVPGQSVPVTHTFHRFSVSGQIQGGDHPCHPPPPGSASAPPPTGLPLSPPTKTCQIFFMWAPLIKILDPPLTSYKKKYKKKSSLARAPTTGPGPGALAPPPPAPPSRRHCSNHNQTNHVNYSKY